MTEKGATILIVDDEDMVLSSLRGLFMLQTSYQVLEAHDPRKALEELARTRVDLVISDFLMPQMNGIEFLKEVKKLQPDDDPRSSHRLRRQGERHQGHQRRRPLSLPRKALGQRSPPEHREKRPQREGPPEIALGKGQGARFAREPARSSRAGAGDGRPGAEKSPPEGFSRDRRLSFREPLSAERGDRGRFLRRRGDGGRRGPPGLGRHRAWRPGGAQHDAAQGSLPRSGSALPRARPSPR